MAIFVSARPNQSALAFFHGVGRLAFVPGQGVIQIVVLELGRAVEPGLAQEHLGLAFVEVVEIGDRLVVAFDEEAVDTR